MGAEINGADVRESVLDEDGFQYVKQALLDYKVITLRNQTLEPDDQVAFTSKFGPVNDGGPKNPFFLEGYPEVTILSNILKDGKPIGFQTDQTDEWHTDITYLDKPSMGAVLYATEVPPEGADTLFADLEAAYIALPDTARDRIDKLRAIHTYPEQYGGKLTESEKAAMPARSHPLVRTHPETGRKSLFVSPMMTIAVEGLGEKESDDLLNELFGHITKPEFMWPAPSGWSTG
ncbi:TauD/TfdA dioxygenase family protein [Rhizorhapis sp. SPR117]|uniref:TauD/TfdA dioxygenase family protein n=1 Tax=Rhizorhapis sp. SPR117 TaxID=2912611 RepID=UPI0023517214